MATDMRAMRFSLDRYELMVKTGVLTEDDRVELIDGEIIEMVPQDAAHSSVINKLTRRLVRHVGDDAVVQAQGPIRLPPGSMPEPDLAVALPPENRYDARHPEPNELLLVVEVARTSQIYDRRRKMPLYARYGIPEAWLIDIPARTLEVYREPREDGYQHIETLGAGSTVSCLAFPDLSIRIEDLLPATN